MALCCAVLAHSVRVCCVLHAFVCLSRLLLKMMERSQLVNKVGREGGAALVFQGGRGGLHLHNTFGVPRF